MTGAKVALSSCYSSLCLSVTLLSLIACQRSFRKRHRHISCHFACDGAVLPELHKGPRELSGTRSRASPLIVVSTCLDSSHLIDSPMLSARSHLTVDRALWSCNHTHLPLLDRGSRLLSSARRVLFAFCVVALTNSAKLALFTERESVVGARAASAEARWRCRHR